MPSSYVTFRKKFIYYIYFELVQEVTSMLFGEKKKGKV